MAAVGKAEENGYAERVIRTIKEEEMYLSKYVDFADAVQQIGHFIEDICMNKRTHSSLRYLTPAEFELAYRLAQHQETRNVHFKMSHLGCERWPHSQRNMRSFVMIIPQPLFNPKRKYWNF